MKHKILQWTKNNYRFIIVILCLFASEHMNAQQVSAVVALRFNNQSTSRAKVNILPPGKGANKTEIAVSDKFGSGTKMIIPIGTVIVLRSPGGTQVVSNINKEKSIEYKVEFSDKGENHIVKGVGAQIENNVKKTLGYSYRNTNERGTTAATKGTEFTFTDLSDGENEKAKIITKEGSIKIIDQVPYYVNGKAIKNDRHGKLTTRSISKTQSAGENIYTSSDEPRENDTYESAINDIKNEIEMEMQNGDVDPEDLAGDLMCLGDLYMVNKEPLSAIDAYRKASNYFTEVYGEDDLYTIEANLSLAAAYLAAGNAAESKEIINASIKFLEESLEDAEDDLKFVLEDDDAENEDIICEDISEIYGYLGWAYEIAEDDANKEKYYKLADEGCN